MCIHKVRAMLREMIQVGGRDATLWIVGFKIPISNVINKEDDDVGALRSCTGKRGRNKGSQEQHRTHPLIEDGFYS